MRIAKQIIFFSVHVLSTKRLILSSFALHQEEELSKLKNKWFFEFWNELPYGIITMKFLVENV